MTAKTLVVVVAIVLAGCRARVREADAAAAPANLREAAAAAARPNASPLRVDRARSSRGGPCEVGAAASGREERIAAAALDRVPVAWDEAQPIVGAWRLSVASGLGAGTIVRVDRPDLPEGFYVGDGIFAGCDQERLASAYSTLLPEDDDLPFLIPLLG